MTKHPSETWTDKDVELLREMWPKKSATQIGIVLSKSRSSIISKARRIKLENKKQGRRAGAIIAAAKKDNELRVHKPVGRPPKGPPRPPAVEPQSAPVLEGNEAVDLSSIGHEGARHISINELTDDICHYPTQTDGRGVPTAYCGLPNRRGKYCAAHAQLCFAASRPPKFRPRSGKYR